MGDRRDQKGRNDEHGQAEERAGDLRKDVTRILSDRTDAVVSASARISSSITDELTGLYSRALLDVVLPKEVVRADRFSQRISLVVFEVDELPELNRRLGYTVGDQLLERLGNLIRHFFRQHDWVFRHGEGSIAVLLYQVAPEDALFLSLWVVAMVEQRLWFTDHHTNDRVRVTVSAAMVSGLGSLDDPLDAERLLLEADSAIGRAKSLGGNRVETATLEPKATTRDDRPQPAPTDQPPSS